MFCPICGQKVDQLFLTARGQRCRECKSLSDVQCHSILERRLDEGKTAAQLLCNEAFEAGDHKTVAVCKGTIANYDLMRATMRKPSVP
jgi:hypothetical protein